MISAAPRSVIPRPRQKAVESLCFKINQVPRATHKGAVLPNRVAFAAVVYEREAVQSPRSQAVNTPASNGKIMELVLIDRFFWARVTKKGSNRKIEKNRR